MKRDAATADRWQQVSQIYHAALERGTADRDAFLRDACAGDESLRREIESLLSYEGAADPWIERPAAAVAAPMLNTSASSSVLPGRQIGPYTIVSLLDAGGMGEVYHARDARLGRDVAIKILPPEFVADADRTARFAREARVLAALNHPHIAQIYGLEQIEPSPAAGQSGGQALVMELVRGETLAAMMRGRRHALKVDQALTMARQIADALEAAHSKGIVHRDLKPANIKVTPEANVKILDFGLAKVTDRISELEPQLSGARDISAGGTRQGVILGTAAYMSPEQARGQQVDKRTDIWAFGCVLFEMLTGHVAFAGDTVSDTIAKILEREPDWAALPDGTPASIRRLLQRCLRKDPGLRLHDLADARIEIEEALGTEVASDNVNTVSKSRRPGERSSWRLLRSAALLVAGIAAGFVASRMADRPDAAAPRPLRFVETLAPGREMPLGFGRGTMVAVSPDGRTLVYSARQNGEWRLFSRSLDQLDQPNATPIGEVNARNPFFSPDGQWIGFASAGRLKRVPVRGGPAQTIVELPGGSSQSGGSWNADDTILLSGGLGGLLRVSESGSGGVETLVAARDGRGIWYPQLLPDRRSVLYTESEARPDAGELMIFDLETRENQTSSSGGRWTLPPHRSSRVRC
ncbi:MAG: protein kinase domain-containing protein [Vicinamibacterales bacterium]